MMHRSTFTTGLVLAIATLTPPLLPEEPTKPTRRPQESGFLEVTLSVPHSVFDFTSGNRSRTTGSIWFERTMGHYVGGADLEVKDAAGRDIDLPSLDFKVDAAYDPNGEEESLGGPSIPNEYLFRALSTSDLALLPMRAMLPHRIEFGGKSKTSHQAKAIGAQVDVAESDLGPGRVGGIMTNRYFTRTVRRFVPSNYELHDYVLTSEDPKDGFVMYSCGLRLLVHPTKTAPDGKRPPSGVFHVTQFEAVQLKWFADGPRFEEDDRLVPAREQKSLRDSKYATGLENALFDALQVEGIGNPFENPAAFAFVHGELLTEKTFQRLINLNQPKVLVLTAPFVVENPIPFDPKAHVAAWKKADDPAERLLLAAAAVAGGEKNAQFKREAEIAVHSKDDTVLRAALVLANALGDASLAERAKQGLSGR